METFLYAYNKYPFNLIGPATLLWCATPQSTTTEHAPAITRGKGGKGKGKGKAAPEPLANPQQTTRVVWIRVHPCIAAKSYEALRLSASFALDAVKQTGRTAEVELADLREHFNIFELVGPKATQVIKGALRPVNDNRAEFNKVSCVQDSV